MVDVTHACSLTNIFVILLHGCSAKDRQPMRDLAPEAARDDSLQSQIEISLKRLKEASKGNNVQENLLQA